MSRFRGVLTAAFLSAAMAFAVAAMAADDSQPSKPTTAQAAQANSAGPPLITKNRDGTFTIQKVPPKGSKDNNTGLVIPPQVVVPFVRLPTAGKKP